VIVLQFVCPSISTPRRRVQVPRFKLRAELFLLTCRNTPIYRKSNPADSPGLTRRSLPTTIASLKGEDLVDTVSLPRARQFKRQWGGEISGGQKPGIRIQVNPVLGSPHMRINMADVRRPLHSNTSVNTVREPSTVFLRAVS